MGNTVELLSTDTSLLRTIIWTTDTKSRPQRVNSYKLNLFYYGHCGDQVNPESRSGEFAQGESRLVGLVSYAK